MSPIFKRIAGPLLLALTVSAQSDSTTITSSAAASVETISCVGESSYAFNGVTASCGPSMTCAATVTDGSNPCQWDMAQLSASDAGAVAVTSSSGAVATSVDNAGSAASSTAAVLAASANVASQTGSSTLWASATGSANGTSAARSATATASTNKRYVGYWSVYASADQMPDATQLDGMTHVILSFADMTTFDSYMTTSFGGFNAGTPAALKAISPDIKVMAAFGGWGLDLAFHPGVQPDNVEAFVKSITSFVQTMQLDGLDIDWEYPVGNGAYYKTVGEDARPYDPSDAANMINFLALLRTSLDALGDGKIISVALPGRTEDMLAYNSSTMPDMDKSVDFWNPDGSKHCVFADKQYDYINRRDNITGYASGKDVVATDVAAYESFGIKADKLNIGFPLYAKWFALQSDTTCTNAAPIGCPMSGFEDSQGVGNSYSGTWAFSDVFNARQAASINVTIQASWQRVSAAANTDNATAASSAYIDTTNNWFWTWQSASDFGATCDAWVDKVGGIMAWSLMEDSNTASGGPHFAALASCIAAAPASSTASGSSSAAASGASTASGVSAASSGAASAATSVSSTASSGAAAASSSGAARRRRLDRGSRL